MAREFKDLAPERLAEQIAFIVEIDKLKGILRQTGLIDGSRRENSAEHSWHLAVMAMILAEHAERPVSLERVLKMLLIHDLVEIDAGDTFFFDAAAAVGKGEREAAAAQRIFALLPSPQREELRSLWDEFEARESADAMFAAALDRLQPMLLNFHVGGGTWLTYGITAEQIRARKHLIAEGSSSLWALADRLIAEAAERGFLAAAPRVAENDG